MANKRKRGSGNPGNRETSEVKDKTIEEKDAVDRFSDLPDHVILKIMSSLPLKEAVRTCVLSKRWTDVFTWISHVDLDGYQRNKSLRNGFMNFVDRFLFLRKDISLNSLRLICGYGMDPRRINGWIHYALRHGVRELDLSIRTREFAELQHGVFTCRTLETLKLCFLPSFIPSVPTNCCLKNLKLLRLWCLKFPDDEFVRRLLSGCVDSLEELIVEGCDLSRINKFSVCSPKLKSLTLSRFQEPCYEVEINTPNLVRLDYHYTVVTKHSFVNLNSLSEACIGVGLTLSPHYCKSVIDLMRGISHVQSLHLTGGYRAVEVLPVLLSVRDQIPIFPKLTYLKMDRSYAGWGTLFATCPSLETLAFDLSAYYPPDWSVTKEVPSGLLHRVKAVEVLIMRREHMDFIDYVLKEASALQSLTVEVNASKKEQRTMGKVICALPKLPKIFKIRYVLPWSKP